MLPRKRMINNCGILTPLGAVEAHKFQTELSPFQEAIIAGNTEDVEFLLKKGATFSEFYEYDQSPVYFVLHAPKFKQTELLKLFIKYREIDRSFIDKYGRDYLQCAIMTTKIRSEIYVDVEEIAVTLLNLGLSVNHFDRNGYSTLVYALELDNIQLVSILIERGANVNLKTTKSDLFSPLYYATEKSIELLLDNGAESDAANSSGWTALLEACHKGRHKVVFSLVHRGADVNWKNRVKKLFPLVLAIRHKNVDTIKLLISHGAEVNAKTATGRTALLEAANYTVMMK